MCVCVWNCTTVFLGQVETEYKWVVFLIFAFSLNQGTYMNLYVQ